MSEEILINITPRETRVAIVESGVLQELQVERVSKRGLVGNIYMGRVVRVLPGMQAAFVEMGLARAAFLHVSDLLQGHEPAIEAEDSPVEIKAPEEDISSILTEGQSLFVQVTKDPLGTKGARLTTQISLPSRYLVFMPMLKHIGISLKIEEEEERERLKAICLDGHDPLTQGGIIIRTRAEGATEAEILADRNYLVTLWKGIESTQKKANQGDLIHEDLPLFLRALRDCISPETERIRIDSTLHFQKALSFSKIFLPKIVDNIDLYYGERPLFEYYNIEDEIQKALVRNVPLKSGGHLVFDQNEAMTTVDVNTGGFVGVRNLEETIFKTNLEAATSIARQLRLRNMGGIIIIDFIDMKQEEHKTLVFKELEKALSKDSVKNKVSEISALGLVQMTRKRTRESLEQIMCEACHVCHGKGTIKTVETVCYEIFRELLRADKAYNAKSYLVLASQSVVDCLLDEESSTMADLEDIIGKPVKLQTEQLYTQENFDVVLM